MNPLLFVLLASGAAVAVSAISTSRTSDKIAYQFKDVILENIQLLSSTLLLRFDAINPTGNDLTIQEISLDLKLNGKEKIGRVYLTKVNMTIQAKMRQTLKVPVLINHIGSGLALYQTIKNGESIDFIQVEGYIKANGFNKTIQQKVPLLSQNQE